MGQRKRDFRSQDELSCSSFQRKQHYVIGSIPSLFVMKKVIEKILNTDTVTVTVTAIAIAIGKKCS